MESRLNGNAWVWVLGIFLLPVSVHAATCPLGESPLMPCTTDADCSAAFGAGISCETADDGTNQCCKTQPKCPDGVNAFVDCKVKSDCEMFDLECREATDFKKYCCAPKDPPTTSSPPTRMCADGVVAFVECQTEQDCSLYQLECQDTGGGEKFCCGTIQTTVATPTAATCPDGVKAGFVECKDDSECQIYDLSCHDTPEGKFCCGDPTTTTSKPVNAQLPFKCPDGTNAFVECNDDSECAPYPGKKCITTKDTQICCDPDPTKPTGATPQKDKCPNGDKPTEQCADQDDCNQYAPETECTTLPNGKKFCCVDGNTPPTSSQGSQEVEPTKGPGGSEEGSPEESEEGGDGHGHCKDRLGAECKRKVHLCKRSEYNRLMNKYCHCTCRPYHSICRNHNGQCNRKRHLCRRKEYQRLMLKWCPKACRKCHKHKQPASRRSRKKHG